MKRNLEILKKSKHILLALALLHLVFVCFSAAYMHLSSKIPLYSLLKFYGKASGADSSYGFFAPSIGSKVRGVFDVIDRNGKVTPNIQLSPEMNREENIRLGGIFEEFTGDEIEDETFRHSLGASLAAVIFSRFVEAERVVIHIEEFVQVSMEDFRNGKRSFWDNIYDATFARTINEVSKDS